MTRKLSDIFQELGISKVKLAKYLGVSRQMIYNYLELDNMNKWPKEKRTLLCKLLGVEEGSDSKALSRIKITPEYINDVERRLNKNLKEVDEMQSLGDLKNFNKEEKNLYKDLTYLIKDKFTDENNHQENIAALTYTYHLLQALSNVNEVKYFLAYISKMTGFVDPNEFKFNEDKQFIFEGIIHSAMTLYSNGGASKTKIIESHARFVQEIETKKEEKLSRTQQLTTYRIQALKELGYTELNDSNADEFLEKLAEIESRSC